MSGVSQIIGPLIMYGVGGAKISMQNWRAMFLLDGGLTILTGIVFLFAIPRNTTTAWFLNETERRVATERLAMDRATRDRTSFSTAQFKEALIDPRTWLYAFMGVCITLPTPILKV